MSKDYNKSAIFVFHLEDKAYKTISIAKDKKKKKGHSLKPKRIIQDC